MRSDSGSRRFFHMPPPDFAVLPYRRLLLLDARFPFPPKVSAGIRIWTPPGSPPSCPEVPAQYRTAGLRQNAGGSVPGLISFFSWLLLSSLFCYFSNITNWRTGSPAGIFLLCCVPLSSGRQYLPDRQIIEGMGNRNPKQEPYTGKHDSVLRGGSCSRKIPIKSSTCKLVDCQEWHNRLTRVDLAL